MKRRIPPHILQKFCLALRRTFWYGGMILAFWILYHLETLVLKLTPGILGLVIGLR